MFKKIGYTALGFLLLSGVAFGGIWNFTLPIIGGASYCGSTVNGSCVSTIPAGPAAVTGAETLPVDTNLANNAMPQSAIVSTQTLANYARGSGLLYVTGTPVAGIAGTGEQTLLTYSLPANTLAAGRMLKIKASYSLAANGNNKTVKCYFGASVISSGVVASNAKNGSCDVTVIYTGAATQTVYANLLNDTTAITGYEAAGTDATTAAVVIKVTGTGGTSGVDITANAMSVELLGQ